MVKTTTSLSLPLLALVALLSGCAGRWVVDLQPETLRFADGAAGGHVSLALAGDTLLGVFADRTTATLDTVQVPLGAHLPDSALVKPVDVVDAAPPVSAAFGRHVLLVSGSTEALLYEDRVAADSTVLKLASRAIGTDQWTLDVMEPPGAPVALLPSPSGSPVSVDVFWAEGSLLWRFLPEPGSAAVLPAFTLAGAPAAFSRDGFTAFDGGDGPAGSLYAVRRSSGGFEAWRVAGAGPVQSALEGSDGVLSVLSWDAAARRLVLLEDAAAPRGPRRSTVTLCNDTTTVALLPGPAAGTYLFLFDESRQSAARGSHIVSLVAPSATFGKPGTRYRKTVLFQSEHRVEGFAAVQTADALYLLVQSAGMALVRAGIRGTASPVS